ncbi:uncharacterized protein [Palaemon carinicauda]|uniref:uncharacterized protein n=1 Tax=Palaemon carinicauda TaxID=392227 RepID=UPI0035B5783D
MSSVRSATKGHSGSDSLYSSDSGISFADDIPSIRSRRYSSVSSSSSSTASSSSRDLQLSINYGACTETRPTNINISEEIALIMNKMGLSNSPHIRKDQSHWFHRLLELLVNVLHMTPVHSLPAFRERICRHLRIRRNGTLSVSLAAASLLKMHPDVDEEDGQMKHYYTLPSPIPERLYQGFFVPIRHILYGEALMRGFAEHYTEGIHVKPNPYPLLLEDDPPRQFVTMIRRPDVFRAITSHSLELGRGFIRLSANMQYITRDIWYLLYNEMVDVQVAMDIYDEFFKEFENQLGLLQVVSIDGIPSSVIEKVKNKNEIDYTVK